MPFNMVAATETFLHEMNHKITQVDDLDRSFANGLSTLLAKMVLKLTTQVGFPVTLKLTNRGFRMPRDFHYSSGNVNSHIATVGNEIVILTAGYVLRATVPLSLRPYSSTRPITFFKGGFYLNLPAGIRKNIPEEVEFFAAKGYEQI